VERYLRHPHQHFDAGIHFLISCCYCSRAVKVEFSARCLEPPYARDSDFDLFSSLLSRVANMTLGRVIQCCKEQQRQVYHISSLTLTLCVLHGSPIHVSVCKSDQSAASVIRPMLHCISALIRGVHMLVSSRRATSRRATHRNEVKAWKH
jgi:hypothetical protein